MKVLSLAAKSHSTLSRVWHQLLNRLHYHRRQ